MAEGKSTITELLLLWFEVGLGVIGAFYLWSFIAPMLTPSSVVTPQA